MNIEYSISVAAVLNPGMLLQVKSFLCEEPVRVEEDLASVRYTFSDGQTLCIAKKSIDHFFLEDDYSGLNDYIRSLCMNMIDETA